MDTLFASLHDLMTYIVAMIGALTCLEFFRTRSKWFVIVGSIVVLILAVILHSQIFNALSILTDLLAIYRHIINVRTGKILWMKVFLILGIPITIWFMAASLPIVLEILQAIWWLMITEIVLVFIWDWYHPSDPPGSTVGMIIGWINIALLVVSLVSILDRIQFYRLNPYEAGALFLLLGVLAFVLPDLPVWLFYHIHIKKEAERRHDDVGSNLMAQKAYQSALATYNHRLYLRPDCADTYYFRGIVLGVLQRYADARDDFGTAVRLGSKYSTDANNQIAVIDKILRK